MKFPLFLFAVALITFGSCNSQNQSSDITVVDSSDSSITLNVNGQKAEYNAIYHLLFRGFPNSNQTVAMISTSEEETQKNFSEYFKKLFTENRYKTFITSSSKNKDGSKRLIINTKALKTDLEQNSIIRKFGY